MACIKCKSERIATMGAKCSDMCLCSIGTVEDGNEHDGYVPDDMGVGGGDYVDFQYCLDCGQIQGAFPLPKTKLEEGR